MLQEPPSLEASMKMKEECTPSPKSALLMFSPIPTIYWHRHLIVNYDPNSKISKLPVPTNNTKKPNDTH